MAFGPPGAPPIAVSRNLTLSAHIRTLEQYKEIFRKGTDFRMPADGNPILQVMPWPVYGNMSDREIEAIWQYLKSIPQVVNTPQQPCVP